MTQLLLENLNPVLINQLETLARLHGRSLQEEIKHLLQQAIQSQLRFYQTGGDMAKAREASLSDTDSVRHCYPERSHRL